MQTEVNETVHTSRSDSISEDIVNVTYQTKERGTSQTISDSFKKDHSASKSNSEVSETKDQSEPLDNSNFYEMQSEKSEAQYNPSKTEDSLISEKEESDENHELNVVQDKGIARISNNDSMYASVQVVEISHDDKQVSSDPYDQHLLSTNDKEKEGEIHTSKELSNKSSESNKEQSTTSLKDIENSSNVDNITTISQEESNARDVNAETEQIDSNKTQNYEAESNLQSNNAQINTLKITENTQSQDSPSGETESNEIFTTQRTSEIEIIERRSQKRKAIDVINDDFAPIDSMSFRKDASKRKVSGKFIEKFWEPIDSQTLHSFNRILHMSLNKTLERYDIPNSKKLSKKLVEAQHILAKSWINESDIQSFITRLNVTKLPLPSTMTSTSKGNKVLDIFSLDQLLRKKTVLETYLSAELKQLNELEKYYKDLEVVFDSDMKYLNEFKKAASTNISKWIEQSNKRNETSKLDSVEPSDDDIKLSETKEVFKEFNPNEDEQTKEILELLNTHLTSISSNTSKLTKINEKLEVIYNIIEML